VRLAGSAAMPASPGLVVRQLTERLEKRKRFLIVLLSILFFLGACGAAANKLLWYDELTTLYIDHQPRLSQALALIYADKDGNPPLFHILSHTSLKLFGENAIAVRLPEILGFWTMCLCLYRFVARRTSPLHGMIAMLFPCLTTAYSYAYEARPYGLVLGFCGLALVFWQRATEGERRAGALTGLALSLAAAVSCHYYAVLLYAPLGIGELVRWWRSKKPDLALWTALVVSGAPILAFLPIIAKHSHYKNVFWAKAHWIDTLGFYVFLLQPAIAPAMLALLILALAWKPGSAPGFKSLAAGPYLHEMAAAISLAVLPLFAMILAKTFTGAFTERYALAAVAGISVLVALIPAAYEGSQPRIAAGMAVAFCISFVVVQFFFMPGLLRGPDNPLAKLALPLGNNSPDTPVVVSDGRLFLQMFYYCPPELRSRLYFLADSEAAMKYTGAGNVDVELPAMTSYVSLNAVPFRQFLASHKRFQLYGPYGTNFDWNASRLLDDGARLELQGRFGGDMLFQTVVP
jgi:4-amino-4-deoxy-L-arabinose transferase-like glycosyltransferase